MAKQAKDDVAGKGHNGFASGRLRSLIERVERLEAEKKALQTDISEVYKEAKGCGFDTKIMREVIKLRRLSTYERQEFEAILDLYKDALGMLADTPLGEAAMDRAKAEHEHV